VEHINCFLTWSQTSPFGAFITFGILNVSSFVAGWLLGSRAGKQQGKHEQSQEQFEQRKAEYSITGQGGSHVRVEKD
jgi:hypothetical protein